MSRHIEYQVEVGGASVILVATMNDELRDEARENEGNTLAVPLDFANARSLGRALLAAADEAETNAQRDPGTDA